MRIDSVTLSGFRCFGPDPITVPISSEITAVVGPNAAGKTALLHALTCHSHFIQKGGGSAPQHLSFRSQEGRNVAFDNMRSAET